MNRSFTILLFLVLTAANSFAQHVSPARETAIKYAQANWQKFGLLAEDVADLVVTDEYTTAHNGATHVWLGQRHQGIPVYNGLFQITVKKDGSVLTIAHRWAKDLAHKANSVNNAVSVKNGLLKALQLIDIQGVEPRLTANPSFGKFTFDKEKWSTWDVPAELVFQPMAKGKPSFPGEADELRLAWAFQIQGANDIHFWHIRIDAITGELLEKVDHAAHEHFGEANESHNSNELSYLEKQACLSEKTAAETTAPTLKMNSATASYNVFAIPTESPNHGPRSIVTDPADLAASPFGWHDTNGVAGAESTRTQGNNVRAYQDEDGNNNPATPADTPDGGAALVFDAPFDPNSEPEDQSSAGVINLFYMNNVMHDFSYSYGFDEVSKNFQVKNYSNSGAGNDPVLAEARDNQFGTNPSTNNANFSTPADGGSGRMQMFIWDKGIAVGGNLVVTAPNQIAGTVETSTSNGWGAPITDIPVCGKVEIVDDGSNNPTFGCKPLLNNLTGKIALIDRQTCEFGLKVLNAQNAGAIGAIIVNFENALLGMGAGAVGNQDTIPVVMVKKIDGDIIRQFATQGTLEVCIVQPTVSGPAALDGDLDNGVIAHEYGHGISGRLVGGGGCIGGAEQMGEGISDLMALVLTAKAGDTGPTPRGMATYVRREDPVTGKGLRKYPYSTDMAINPETYADVATDPEVHAVGSVWTAIFWEVYWKLVDKYGFDADLYHGTGGNNKAIQLMFDAMKLSPCNPGFLDMRDAVFAADEIDFGGIHKCLLWEAFAKRGCGVDAIQGLASNAGDQVAGFEPLPTCIMELKIKKSVDKDLINPGETVNVTLDIVNHKPGPVTGVVVTDELPDGMSYVAGSATNGGTYDAVNKVVKWTLGTIAPLGEKTLTYQASTSTLAPFKSTRYYFDDMENGDANWGFDVTVGDGSILWSQTNLLAYSGATSWYAEESAAALDITLNYITPVVISGANSTARFWHRYDSENGADGGFVEISINGGNYIPIKKSEYLRRAPFGIQYATFVLANLAAYSGDSQDWVDSYIDLTAYTGKEVQLRWRFGCDDNTAAGDGWFVDDVEIMNLFKYDGSATITSNEGDNVNAKAPNHGIFVNSDGSVGTDTPAENAVGLQANPNPAHEMLYLTLSGEPIGDSRVSLVSVDGRLVKTMNANFQSPTQIVPLDLIDVVSGVYFVRVESAKGSGVVKVVVR